ncbi:hypothetical protein MAGR_25360 [Mycolicibacterium agri]|uniref:Uncharacterized protein n=1 Tax=Mycolicibacterium agri TaxID=36811 RepID=A0A7I9W048_MYCAG|nr:hypothetical protein MAGR_25360 [Mycolicibacterium agri]
MMARSVWRQRPQSAPAPHAAATCLEVTAPVATTSATISLVAPVQRQTNNRCHLTVAILADFPGPTEKGKPYLTKRKGCARTEAMG